MEFQGTIKTCEIWSYNNKTTKMLLLKCWRWLLKVCDFFVLFLFFGLFYCCDFAECFLLWPYVSSLNTNKKKFFLSFCFLFFVFYSVVIHFTKQTVEYACKLPEKIGNKNGRNTTHTHTYTHTLEEIKSDEVAFNTHPDTNQLKYTTKVDLWMVLYLIHPTMINHANLVHKH